MNDPKKTKCKCGRWIIWGYRMYDGRRIPLDPVAPVYELDERGNVYRAPKERFYVSHFATCRFASEFSGKAKHTETFKPGGTI